MLFKQSSRFFDRVLSWRVALGWWLALGVAPAFGAEGAKARSLPAPDPDQPAVAAAAIPGEVIVRFKPATAAARRQAILGQPGRSWRRLRGAPDSPLRKQAATAGGESVFDQLAIVTLEPRADLEGAAARLRRHPEVAYVEPNYRIRLLEDGPGPLPDDFEFGTQWSFHNGGEEGGVAGADIRAPEAWAVTTGDPSVVVAVIDTGIDFFHPDLAQNIWTNSREVAGNGADDDGNGYLDDTHGYDFTNGDADPLDDLGHGTHVAGTVGASGNNHIGVAGVCWRVSIMALKAFDEAGNSDIVKVVEAIHYAVNNGARVINASWGYSTRSRVMEEAIREAHAAGLVIIGAAGNENSDAAFYPAALDEVVSVGATDRKDERAKFSSYGPTLDVAAPGDSIYSTVINNRYDVSSGTSMSAPHVTGIAALLLSRHPEFTNREVENILRNATDQITTDQYVGSGRINAARAVAINGPLPDARLVLPAQLRGRAVFIGTAGGPDFARYTLEYGPGNNPTNWVPLFTATQAVTNGVLFAGFDTSILEEQSYTFRLVVGNTRGDSARARAVVEVRNIHIAFPLNNDLLRARQVIPIRGTAFGPNTSYRVQYGVGRLPREWREDGITLADAGAKPVIDSVLATWDTSPLPPDEVYTLRLTARTSDTREGEYQVPMVYLDGQLRAGWPQYLPALGEYPVEDWRQVVAADLDHDGRQSLLLVDHSNNEGQLARLLVFNPDGSLRWSRDLADGPPFSDVPVVGDLDGDGYPEIFVDAGANHLLHAFRRDGSTLPGQWPVHLPAGNLGKVIADVLGDGRKELVAFANDTESDSDDGPRWLYVFDQTGKIIRQWSVPSCGATLDAMKILPTVGNLDGGLDSEIVVPSGCGRLAAYKFSQADGPLWVAYTDGNIFSSAVIGDLDHNGTNEVVAAAYDPANAKRGGVHVFDNRGARRRGWPALLEESFAAPIALADMDGDGRLEICVPSWPSRKLHLLRANGFEVPGWPVAAPGNGPLRSGAVIGEIDGSGQPAVVLPSAGSFLQAIWMGDLGKFGGVRAWRFDGSVIDLNPHNRIEPLVMEASGGESRLKNAPVILTDLDGNGKLDIVAMSVQDALYSPSGPPSKLKRRSSLYVWELDTPFRPGQMHWPALHGPQHTGLYVPPPKPPRAPVIGEIPDQTIQAGRAFLPVELDRYVDDSDNEPEELKWTVTGASRFRVTISTNRVAHIEPVDPNWVGEEAVRLTVTDPSGLSASRPVVFTVKTRYDPPVAREDKVILAEDAATSINPLANDTDPEAYPLAIIGFSKPRHGSLAILPDGQLRYTPATNYAGADQFNYTVNNGHGGLVTGAVQLEVTPVADAPDAVADQLSTNEDTPVSFDPLANDLDPDGNALWLANFDQPAHGSVQSRPDGTFLFTPAANYFGQDRFKYRVTDGVFEVTADVLLVIKPVNDPPVAQDQAFRINRNASQNLTYLAKDVDNEDLTFKVGRGPEHGELLTFPTVATYSPKKGYVGTDSFTYTANDGLLESAPATVTFEIVAENNAPDAPDRTVATKQNQTLTISLTAPDVDGDAVTFVIVTPPDHGSLSTSGTNHLYQPEPGYLGEDKFTYRATDGKTPSRLATVTINVTDQNTAPVSLDTFVTVIENNTTNFFLAAYDPEGDPLTYEILTQPLRGKLSGTPPELVFTPQKDFIGPDRFTFKVKDSELTSDVATVSFNIRHPNTPPEVNDQTITLTRNQPLPLILDLRDAENDSLQVPILKGPKHGFVFGTGTNLTYRPQPGYLGTDSFTYKVWDGTIYSKEARVTLYVTTPPDPPPFVFKAIDTPAAGQVRIFLSAATDSEVRLDMSTNLVDWRVLDRQTAQGGQITFVDTNNPATTGQRFYRAVRTGGPASQ